jgi:aminopeptidase N
MEYPGLVVVEDSLYPTGSRVEWLTAHEVAHQWWFGLVGSDQVDEPWLDEALTQYSTFLYYEAVYGAGRARGVLNAEFIHAHRELVRSGRDLPAGLPASSYSSGLYWPVVYDKGALYFHNLRETIGDAAFFEVLQIYFQDNRYGIATPEDWLAAVEKVTGDRHLAIYQNWIVGSSVEGTE